MQVQRHIHSLTEQRGEHARWAFLFCFCFCFATGYVLLHTEEANLRTGGGVSFLALVFEASIRSAQTRIWRTYRYLNRRASRSDSSRTRMSSWRTGPLTFRTMDRVGSSRNSTRTCGRRKAAQKNAQILRCRVRAHCVRQGQGFRQLRSAPGCIRSAPASPHPESQSGRGRASPLRVGSGRPL